jgi:predicted HicB family RNase H-like nuclease
MPTSKPKPKKPGRPRMAKGEAKGSIMPVRFSPEERKRVEAAARANKQTVSAWVRNTLNAALQAQI